MMMLVTFCLNKNFKRRLFLLVVAVSTCLLVQPIPKASANPLQHLQQLHAEMFPNVPLYKLWEYKLVAIPHLERIDEHNRMLNELGSEGWELVSVTQFHEGDNSWRYFFKRPSLAVLEAPSELPSIEQAPSLGKSEAKPRDRTRPQSTNPIDANSTEVLSVLQQNINREWIIPMTASSGLSAQVSLTLSPGGDRVADYTMIKSSGDLALDRSVSRAIESARFPSRYRSIIGGQTYTLLFRPPS